jgi:hypothetical protein
MDRIARELLGVPNERLSNQHKKLRYGTNGSLSIDLAKGTFYDFEARQGGGVLDLIAREKGLVGEAAFADIVPQKRDRLAAVSPDSICAFCAPKSSARFAEWAEPGADLLCEELRLLPGRKVPAFVDLVVVDELGIRLFCPTPRGRADVVRKDAHRHRNGDLFRGEEGQLVLPIEASRWHARPRQPVERDVVEDVVSRQTLFLTRKDARDQFVTAYVVVEDLGGQADRWILDAIHGHGTASVALGQFFMTALFRLWDRANDCYVALVEFDFARPQPCDLSAAQAADRAEQERDRQP